MSFEGYYQVICENDHYQRIDCYWYSEGKFCCESALNGKKCGAPVKWSNLVDETNEADAGRVAIVQMTERVVKTCGLGHRHVWDEATHVPMPNGPLGLLAEQAE